jgi:hypothetical protein
MVADRLDDGVRIAQLLASEVTGNESDLRGLTVADADRDVEPTPDGALAYRIAREAGDPVAEVYVQPDRARIEALAAPDAVADAAAAAGLRVRPKAVRPPRTLVFVEDGAAVKRSLAVLEALRTGPDAE